MFEVVVNGESRVNIGGKHINHIMSLNRLDGFPIVERQRQGILGPATPFMPRKSPFHIHRGDKYPFHVLAIVLWFNSLTNANTYSMLALFRDLGLST